MTVQSLEIHLKKLESNHMKTMCKGDKKMQELKNKKYELEVKVYYLQKEMNSNYLGVNI